MLKQNTAVICLSNSSGGQELDSLKFAQKISRYSNTVFIAKKDRFTHHKFDKYVSIEDNISLETIDFYFSFSLNIIIRVRDIIKKYDVKNVVFFGTKELKSLFFAFIGFDINLILRHGTTRTTPRKHIFHKLIYRNVDYHVSISKHIEKCMKNTIPFGRKTKSVVIYCSVKAIDFEKEKKSKLILLHTGRILKAKGQEDAIKACKVLVDNNIDFLFYVVGEQEKAYSKSFMKMYEALAYKDKIVLVGFTDDIEQYIIKSDIFLYPSYGEGLSNSFLEALSNGLACVSYNNTVFPEIKQLGFEFEMVENKNIDKLSESLLAIAKAQRSFDVSKNRQIAETLLSEEIELSSYLEILK